MKMKYPAEAGYEIKFAPYAAAFHAQSAFHAAKRHFTCPAGQISLQTKRQLSL
jgi:hypothetical protein